MTSHFFSAKAFLHVGRMMGRLRYPVSLPQEVADAVGFRGAPVFSFRELLQRLTNPGCVLYNFIRMMPREVAEGLFEKAARKESFGAYSIYSYYFRQGWLEFVLHFDDMGRLRRVYLQHRSIRSPSGQELVLRSPQANIDGYHFS